MYLLAVCVACCFVHYLVCCLSCWQAGPCLVYWSSYLVVVVVVVCVEDACSSVLLLHLGEVRGFPDVCLLVLADCVGPQMFVGCFWAIVWVPRCLLVVSGRLCASPNVCWLSLGDCVHLQMFVGCF